MSNCVNRAVHCLGNSQWASRRVDDVSVIRLAQSRKSVKAEETSGPGCTLENFPTITDSKTKIIDIRIASTDFENYPLNYMKFPQLFIHKISLTEIKCDRKWSWLCPNATSQRQTFDKWQLSYTSSQYSVRVETTPSNWLQSEGTMVIAWSYLNIPKISKLGG